jgi:hypothetical protein
MDHAVELGDDTFVFKGNGADLYYPVSPLRRKTGGLDIECYVTSDTFSDISIASIWMLIAVSDI